MPEKKLKVAVVVGHHSYEVQPFQNLFTCIPEIDCYIQHLEQFTSSSKEVRESYDVIVFYTMWLDTPVNDGPWYEGRALDALSALGETRQGIFMLHHSILAFQDWPLWAEICGVSAEHYKDYHLDVPMDYHVEDGEHPVTRGLQDFSMVDEAYEMESCASNCHVLITTNNAKNIPTVAWITEYKGSKVLCYQSGHCNTSYADPNFREIVRRGILWLGGKLQ